MSFVHFLSLELQFSFIFLIGLQEFFICDSFKNCLGHVYFPLGLPYLLEFLFKKLDIWNPNLAYDLGEAKRFEFFF